MEESRVQFASWEEAGPTNKGHMKGDDYLNHFLLPNFHFHVTAAYAILRHYGVDIGKSDFFWCDPHEDDLTQARTLRITRKAISQERSRLAYLTMVADLSGGLHSAKELGAFDIN